MRLSVIVGIVDGGAQLERCLAALAAQMDTAVAADLVSGRDRTAGADLVSARDQTAGADLVSARGTLELEVFVPWDDTVAGIDEFRARYPAFHFPAMGHVPTEYPPASHAGLHELYDKRRADGLKRATGELVAILEDRSVPEPDWARTAVRMHAEHANAVIGGAIANGRTTLRGLADYLCDFYRYQPPLPAGPREYVSNVNICYKRSALERTRALWQDAYYDLTVHWALQREGEQLWLAPEFLVRQMRGDGERLGALLSERVAWGRRFAVRRSRETSGVGRFRYALQSPLVPLVLWSRVARGMKGRTGQLLTATPFMLMIFGAWGLGEFIGYVTGKQ